MAIGEYLGEFEQIVLMALLQLGQDGYGMAVQREIIERTGRQVSIGAVYATLERLEVKSLVMSIIDGPTPIRGGRGKRFFRVVSHGEQALWRSQHALARMREGLASIDP